MSGAAPAGVAGEAPATPAPVATPPAAAAPAAADAPAAPKADAAAPPPASAYRPEGLPDHLAGKSDQETIDKLFKSVDGFRRTTAERGEVPKDAKGYTFEAPEAVKPFVELLDKDPFFAKVKEFALQSQIPAKQFNSFLGAVLNEMVAGDLVAEPFNADKERALLAPDVADPRERATKADGIVRENIARVQAWAEQGMPKEASTYLLSGLDRASANKLVQWIAASRTEQAPALKGDTPGPAASSPKDLRARLADPRNTPGHDKYDPGYARETDELFKRAYPG